MATNTMTLDARGHLINNTVRAITGAEMAHDGQIQAIRRLLYEKADTILVAPTAYGKRAVLYAFALLTGKIIIQIIPSESVAKDQARIISAEVHGSKPIVVTGGLIATTNFFEKMRAGKYSHMLVSPELAARPKFIQELTCDPEFEKKLGLFTIHDLHLVNMWKDYCTNGVCLDELRDALPSVPWYASTAAPDLESQQLVPKLVGFDLEHTKYIRVPLGRPEISEMLSPLDSENDFGHLNFVLAGAAPTEIRQITKTVVYVADTAQLHKVRRSLCLYAQKLGFSKTQAKQVIQKYDVDELRDEEKDALFRNLSDDTDCRIVVSTVSLSMGWNLPDVIRVVHWGFPMDGKNISIGEWWQRNGVIMRDIGKAKGLGHESGTSYTFAASDRLEELDRLMEKYSASSLAAMNLGNVSPDNTARPKTPEGPSTAHEDQSNAGKGLPLGGETDSEESDRGSAASTSYDSSPSSTSTMSSLGALELIYGHAEDENEYEGMPAEGTLAWFALQNISDYCWEKASLRDDLPAELTDAEFDYEGSRFYMDIPLQLALSRVYTRALVTGQEVPFNDMWSLLEQVPEMEDWEFWYSQHDVDELIQYCHNTVNRVYKNWEASKSRGI